MLISLVSVRHSPGASTAALALGWVWPRHALVAECDPAGGEALLALDPEQRQGNRGLFEMLVDARMKPLDQALWGQVVGLPDGSGMHWVLGGTRSAKETASIDWPRVAELFQAQESLEVLADCGPLFNVGVPRPVLDAADLTVVVVRNDARSIRSLYWWLDVVREQTGAAGRGDDAVVALVVEQDPLAGGWPAKEIDAKLREQGIPVVATMLPWDPEAAAVLAHGRDADRRFGGSRLLRAAKAVAAEIGHRGWQRRQRLSTTGRGVAAAAGHHPPMVARTERLVTRTPPPVPRRGETEDPGDAGDGGGEARRSGLRDEVRDVG